MNKYDIVRKIEEFAPLETQESWDASGWVVDLENPEVNKIMLPLLYPALTNRLMAKSMALSNLSPLSGTIFGTICGIIFFIKLLIDVLKFEQKP